MNSGQQYHGLVVPEGTPVTPTGQLDQPAVERLVATLLGASVDRILVPDSIGHPNPADVLPVAASTE